LVAVPRDISGRKIPLRDAGASLGSSEEANGAFSLAIVIEELDPGNKWLSFGVGLDLPRVGSFFGEAEGTVGITQSVYDEKHRQARSKSGFGRRVDRSDDKLRRPVQKGTRLALQLSPRGEDGCRTLRFFIDKAPSAVYYEIEDDGVSP